MSNTERRAALADFLRSRRARIHPAEVGIASWGRRRTKGLRREEVAMLAGIGATWYTWLEQGRDITVSADLLERLSQTLRLNADERLHLFVLAGRRLPEEGPVTRQQVGSVLQSLLDALYPCPAYIRNHRWDVLAWNKAEKLITDWGALPPLERNALVNHFLNPLLRDLLVDWESDGQQMVALFRADYARYVDDPAFIETVNRLQQRSSEFAQWWSKYEVQQRREEPMVLYHSQVGRFVLDRLIVAVELEPPLIMRVLLPLQGTDSREKLEALAQINRNSYL